MVTVPDESQIPELRDAVARACRIPQLARDVLGHVSVRIGDGRMLIRGRGPGEHGLLFTTIDDIRLVDFSGAGDDPLLDGERTAHPRRDPPRPPAGQRGRARIAWPWPDNPPGGVPSPAGGRPAGLAQLSGSPCSSVAIWSAAAGAARL